LFASKKAEEEIEAKIKAHELEEFRKKEIEKEE
jgi:hypothetical protein